LLNEAPQTDISQNYRVGIDIDRSRLAAQTENAEAALRTLRGLRPRINSIANDSIQSDYYDVVAEAERRAGRVDLAINSMYAAADIAEKRQTSLKTDIDRILWARDARDLFSQLVELKLESHDPLGALVTLEGFQNEMPLIASQGGRIRERRTLSLPSSVRSTQEESNRDALPRPSSATVLVYSLLSDGLAIWNSTIRASRSERLRKIRDTFVFWSTAS
jgi:hypothetical protein